MRADILKIIKQNTAFSAVMIAGIILTFWGIGHETFWCDESVTANLMRQSFGEIIQRLITTDYHPPLYFLALKSWTLLFGISEISLRTFSTIGLVALSLLGAGPVKRALGKNAGILFSLLVFIFPLSTSLAQEARMYSWLCFFVTGAMAYGYLAATRESKRDTVVFTLFCILAVYTHAYAFIEIPILYAVLFAYSFRQRKTIPGQLLISAFFVCLALSPWLPVLFSQLGRTRADFWIPKPNVMLAIGTTIYPLTDKFGIINSIPLTVAAFSISIFLLIKGAAAGLKQSAQGSGLALLSAVLIGITYTVSMVFSFLVSPIFWPKYFFSLFGAYALIITVSVFTFKNRRIAFGVMAVFLILMIPQRMHIYINRANGPIAEARQYLMDKVNDSDVFVHGDHHTFLTFCYYFPRNSHYLYNAGKFRTARFQYCPNGFWGNGLAGFIEGNKNIWLVNRDLNKEHSKVDEFLNSIETKTFEPMGYHSKSAESIKFRVEVPWYPSRKYRDFEMTPNWFTFTIIGLGKPGD